MRTIFILLGVLLFSKVYSQQGRVGINTTSPQVTLDIQHYTGGPETSPQGVSFPNFTTERRSKFTNVKIGTMIFNTDKKCIEIYLGMVNGVAHWSCMNCCNGTNPQYNLAVQGIGFNGTYTAGVALNSSNTVRFRVTNNSSQAISNVNLTNAVTISNGGAITAVGNAANNLSFNPGETKEIVYTLSGTPQQGTLTANFSYQGAMASISTQVSNPIPLPNGNANVQSRKVYIFSMGYNGKVIQGKINNGAQRLVIKLPYTNGVGQYGNISQTRTTTTGHGGDINDLTLSIPAGSLSNTGELTATIQVNGDGEYLAKRLAPGIQETIATFNLHLNNNTSSSFTVEIIAIGGIPDKQFDQATNGQYLHRFIYIPVTGPDGRTWLNHNLGADYTNIDSPHFNPLQQATSDSDSRAYGSLFQWGRDSDGHELILWDNGPSRRFTGMLLANGGYANFTNDPCPDGYSTPSRYEWENLVYQNVQPYNSSLKLTKAGGIYATNRTGARFLYQGEGGYYWSRDNLQGYGMPAYSGAATFSFDSSGIQITSTIKSNPKSIRCIKN